MLEQDVYSDLISIQTKHHVKTTSILVNQLLKSSFKYKNQIDELETNIDRLNSVIQKQYEDIQSYRNQRDEYFLQLNKIKEGDKNEKQIKTKQ
jgi:hypothetical protein